MQVETQVTEPVPSYSGGNCVQFESGVLPATAYVPPSGPALLPFPVPDSPPIPIHQPMPSITGDGGMPSVAADTLPAGAGCGIAGWVDSHKLLSAALVLGGFLLLRR